MAFAQCELIKGQVMPGIKFLVVLSFLTLTSFSASAGIIKSDSVQALGPKFKDLVSHEIATGSYKSGSETRYDKIFFAIEHNYVSSFPKKDLDYFFNPHNDRLPVMFSDPIELQLTSGNNFKVKSSINVLVDTLNFTNQLTYTSTSSANKSTHIYDFHHFNMFFLSSKIKVSVVEKDGESQVQILQVAAIKGSAFSKISKVPFGEATFKKRILGNIKKFEKTTGGR